MASTRIYLDNAATSWPKPEAVYQAVDHYQRQLGASPSRSVYAEALEVDRIVQATRMALVRLLDGEGPEHLVFTLNGSDALNLAIHGVLRPGDHVITSAVEHNSVLRPLRWLEDRGEIEVTRVACGADGIVDPDAIRAAWRPATRLVALVHASNVTGALQPIVEVGRIVREQEGLFLVDAAQSLGHVPLSVTEAHIDLLAAPGHKGLLGPLGTGLLWIRPGVESEVAPLRQGGTGTRSQEDRQPHELPDRFEPGNVNALGVCGLQAGVEFVQRTGITTLRTHAVQLTRRLREGLAAIARVRLYGPADPQWRVGVVSMTLQGVSPQELAVILEAGYRIQVRAGLHCAPRMHAALGTLATGGTVRFSLGPSNTAEQIDMVIGAVEAIAAETAGA